MEQPRQAGEEMGVSESIISSAKIPFLVQLAEGRQCRLWF